MRPSGSSRMQHALAVLAATVSACSSLGSAAAQPAQTSDSHFLKEFGIWIAVAALIAGAGKFLDDYHVGKATKERIRSALIKGFIFLETPLFSRLNPFGPSNLWMIWFTLVYMASLFAYPTAIDKIGAWFGNPWFIAYLKVPPLSILFAAAGLSLLWVRNLSMWLIRQSLKRLEAAGPPAAIADQPEAVRQFAVAFIKRRVRWINIAGLGLLLIWAGILRYYSAPSYTVGQIAETVAYAFVPTLLLYLLFYAAIILLILLNMIVKLVQKIIQHTFDKGSAPTTAPFTYFGALLGIVVLIAKLVEAGLK
jgi:hypothetical protein